MSEISNVAIENSANENDGKTYTNSRIHFSNEVRSAMDQVLKSDDPMDAPDFNVVDFINELFPNEQSLVSIDETIQRMQCEVSLIDENIRSVVRGQTNTGQDGQLALCEAQKVISALYTHITDVKTRAEQTEEMVKEITRDIKQLDCAKKNLTSAITTLNHLHMLVGGIESLNSLIEKRAYGEILNPLQAITEVNEHFQLYSDIDEIKQLSQSVLGIQVTLAQQITNDFKQAFSAKPTTANNNATPRLGLHQLADACKVVSVLDAKVRRELLKWFIAQQLEEYLQLFHENQDIAWLDKIDKRYAWLKRHLLDFENKFGAVFPLDWEVSERITVEFCRLTREQLSSIMSKRVNEIEVRLLLFAINKTQAFEQLLSKRFSGVTLGGSVKTNATISTELSTEQLDTNSTTSTTGQVGIFHDQIGSCFKAHLDIYIRSVDRNLAELMEKFVETSKEPIRIAEIKTTVYSSSADLFVFYKKCMVQCNQLSNEQPMYDLALVFKKYLHEYASRVLEFSMPKLVQASSTSAIGKSMSMLTRDMQNLSTAVFQNFLKDGETPRFRHDDLVRICCVLTTAEYCLETVQQLEEKLKEKVSAVLVNKIDMSEEKDVFHRVISNCIQVLVQDLENGCDVALQAMAKVQWQSISNVGDQSSFISSMCNNFKHTVPVIRDNLSASRKYFTQFCHKFVNTFIPKFINVLYKCKLALSDGSNNVLGCEQLLLDTHSLKTALLDLPSVGSSVNRKAPTSYTKVVVKDMTRAEMIIKVVMTPVQPANQFTQQVLKLLPDITIAEYQRILDMKAVKRVDQLQLIDLFKRTASTAAAAGLIEADTSAPAEAEVESDQTANSSMNESSETIEPVNANVSSSTPKRAFIFSVGSFTGSSGGGNTNGTGEKSTDNSGRIKKLENLLKKRLP